MDYRTQHISGLIPEAVFSLHRRWAALQEDGTSAPGGEREEPSSRLHASDRQRLQGADAAPRTAQAA